MHAFQELQEFSSCCARLCNRIRAALDTEARSKMEHELTDLAAIFEIKVYSMLGSSVRSASVAWAPYCYLMSRKKSSASMLQLICCAQEEEVGESRRDISDEDVPLGRGHWQILEFSKKGVFAIQPSLYSSPSYRMPDTSWVAYLSLKVRKSIQSEDCLHHQCGVLLAGCARAKKLGEDGGAINLDLADIQSAVALALARLATLCVERLLALGRSLLAHARSACPAEDGIDWPLNNSATSASMLRTEVCIGSFFREIFLCIIIPALLLMHKLVSAVAVSCR